MSKTPVTLIKSITEFHSLRGLNKPEHPLISVVNMNEIKVFATSKKMAFDFYFISLKHAIGANYHYGQENYNFDEGVLSFMAPNQVFGLDVNNTSTIPTGYMLLVHDDFLWNTPVARSIKKYDYFNYAVNEALYLTEKEEKLITQIIETIQQECRSNMDRFTKNILISHIETLLSYSERFYNRQFIVREKASHQVLEQLEKLLIEYFNNINLISTGLPTVQYVADSLNLSPSYLGSLLRMLTGLNTQQHIHEKLIVKAKEQLSTTQLTITEIAYKLGFEHPQSFSKLFKIKTQTSPSAFRESFN
jgi:AraC family transcriptional activator of pobA